MAQITIKGSVGLFMEQLAAGILKRSPSLMMEAAWIATGEVKREVFASAKGGTGALARSFEPKALKGEEGKTVVGTFSDLPYAGPQDEGSTIRAKSGMLAIPLSDKARRTAGLWPRDWPQGVLHLVKRKSGPPLLVENKNNKSIFHYVLKKSISLSGSPLVGYLDRATKASTPEIEDLIGGEIQAEIDEQEGKS